MPVKSWVHVTVTYDGSSRASGVRIYLDGAPAETEVERDGLTRNLAVSGSGFVFGDRFRSPGLKGGKLDDLRIFGRFPTPIEAAHVHDGKRSPMRSPDRTPRSLRIITSASSTRLRLTPAGVAAGPRAAVRGRDGCQ
ncbi:MAG: LamG-like jellyroll fold domain-containing protein [Isosphaeraceae bacterium]